MELCTFGQSVAEVLMHIPADGHPITCSKSATWPEGKQRRVAQSYKYNPLVYDDIILNMTQTDIISALADRPFLSDLCSKIFSYLDLKSLRDCKAVSGRWKRAVTLLPVPVKREIDWIDRSFSPQSLPLTNPRDLTQSWALVSPFDNGNLDKLFIDQFERMVVSSGRQIWVFNPKGVLAQYIVLDTTEAMFIHTSEKHVIVFDAVASVLIYDIATGKLIKSKPYIPTQYAVKNAEGEIYEIPRSCYFKDNKYYLLTTRQVAIWTIDPDLNMTFDQLYVHNNRRSNLHAICVGGNTVFLSIGGYQFGANEIVFEGVVIPRKNCYIRELTMKGEVVRDIGKDPSSTHLTVVRQICRRDNMLITLSFDDTIKIWNLVSGALVRTFSVDNLSCSSKIVLTGRMMIWSVWGKLHFYDLDRMETAADTADLKLRSIQFRHDVSDFIYDHHRIVLCSKRLHVVCNLEHYDR